MANMLQNEHNLTNSTMITVHQTERVRGEQRKVEGVEELQ